MAIRLLTADPAPAAGGGVDLLSLVEYREEGARPPLLARYREDPLPEPGGDRRVFVGRLRQWWDRV